MIASNLFKVTTAVALALLMSACASPATPTHTPSTVTTVPPTATTLPPIGTSTSTPTRTPVPTATLTPIPCTGTLRECADRKQLEIGVYFNRSWWGYAKWHEIVAREFNLAVIFHGFCWCDVERTRGQFNFSFGDEQVNFARSKNMRIVGHPLLLAESGYIPEWIANGNFSREELTELLRNYIVQTMTRYKGQIGEYIVVDGVPLNTDSDVLYSKFGYDYIDLAFQIARETDPSAVLIYADVDNETFAGKKTQLTRQTVQRLKSKGLVDGVGMEMHLDGAKPYPKQDVIATMKSYGVPIYVTEIDVDLTNVPGTPQERYVHQAQVYGDMLAACLETGVCKSYSVWGIGDKHSWLERNSPNADATLFDDNLEPKPAFFALQDLLR